MRERITQSSSSVEVFSIGLDTVNRNCAPDSELDVTIKKLEKEHTLLGQEKAEKLLRGVEADFAHLIVKFGDASRKMNLLSFLSKEKKKMPAPPPLPSWSEAVSVMYNKQLNCFGDELVDVLYTPDKTKRFVLLKSDKGYFRFVYSQLN